MTHRLFVYGTLAPGRPNAHVLADVPGQWEPATVTGTLRQQGWGAEVGYPGIVLDARGGEVEGFLFSSEHLAECWARLDAFEGEDGEPWQPDAAAWQHWPAPASAAPHSEELAFWRRAGERLLACLEQLPLPQRSAFLLHHDDGLALDEVASALEVGFETAKTRLRYAMSKLRTCMGAYLAPQGEAR